MITTQQTLKQDFLLDPDITFLNHGSFGATPRPVFETYQKWQRELERQPVEFLGRKVYSLLSTARHSLEEVLGAQPDSLVYVTNVTEALNIVARSLHLGPNDEVLASGMEYGAMDRTWRFLSTKETFKYINHPISVPVLDRKKVVDEFLKGISRHTRVIFLSHISSPTGMIFPVPEICQAARERNILTVIDGAHAPGQIDLDLESLGADFYGGNCHKWLCAPKGAGFLYASPQAQKLVEPLIVSWGWQSENPGPSPFIDLLEWTGTRDVSAFLTVPAAIEYQRKNNWPEFRLHCHALAEDAMRRISDLTKLEPLYPVTSEWFAQMGTARLPDQTDTVWLQKALWEQFRIEIPIIDWNGIKLIRFSYQAYNSKEDTERLLAALKKLLN